jgi:hypothetical protein
MSFLVAFFGERFHHQAVRVIQQGKFDLALME